MPETFCIFVGHGRSGHSLVGALLDAHKQIVMAHEANILNAVKKGAKRSKIFSILRRNSQKQARRGRKWHRHGRWRYKYGVPNQYQGKVKGIKVIGDKKGGRSAITLAKEPSLWRRLKRTVQIPVKVICVIRNPFDNIASLMDKKRNKKTWLAAFRAYWRGVRYLKKVRRLLRGHVLDVYYENLVQRPQEELRRIVNWLGLKADEKYLADCASIVYPSVNPSRKKWNWTAQQIAVVLKRKNQYGWLKRYDFHAR